MKSVIDDSWINYQYTGVGKDFDLFNSKVEYTFEKKCNAFRTLLY